MVALALTNVADIKNDSLFQILLVSVVNLLLICGLNDLPFELRSCREHVVCKRKLFLDNHNISDLFKSSKFLLQCNPVEIFNQISNMRCGILKAKSFPFRLTRGNKLDSNLGNHNSDEEALRRHSRNKNLRHERRKQILGFQLFWSHIFTLSELENCLFAINNPNLLKKMLQQSIDTQKKKPKIPARPVIKKRYRQYAASLCCQSPRPF